MKNGEYELVVPPADYPGKRYRDGMLMSTT